MKYEEKLAALREAWLDLPFDGVVPVGWGEPLQALVNATVAIVDPDRTLRETPEAIARGGIASLKQQAAYAASQAQTARDYVQANAVSDGATWQKKHDVLVAECRERFGVELP